MPTATSIRPVPTPPPDATDAVERTRVFLVCSGLGNVRRGYEAFFRDCFEVLRGQPGIDVWLFKGAGADGERDISLIHLPRAGFAARIVGDLTRRGPYVVEQATFIPGLVPHLIAKRPHVIYYCDPTIGRLLAHWRRVSGATYRLLLHNGGPHDPPFKWCDHIHQLTPSAYATAIAAGVEPDRQTLLPCGIRHLDWLEPAGADDRPLIRRRLGLPLDHPVVLSVGALNRGHKRMDYLISEIARLPEPRPFLVLLGARESETPAVRAIAELLLGPTGFTMRTVAPDEIGAYYRAADLFALASLTEAFGLVYAEALGYGLPCIAHDSPVTRFVLGDAGLFADLRRQGNLAALVRDALAGGDDAEERNRRRQSARERFAWSKLAPLYVAMMQHLGRPSSAPVAALAWPPARPSDTGASAATRS